MNKQQIKGLGAILKKIKILSYLLIKLISHIDSLLDINETINKSLFYL